MVVRRHRSFILRVAICLLGGTSYAALVGVVCVALLGESSSVTLGEGARRGLAEVLDAKLLASPRYATTDWASRIWIVLTMKLWYAPFLGLLCGVATPSIRSFHKWIIGKSPYPPNRQVADENNPITIPHLKYHTFKALSMNHSK